MIGVMAPGSQYRRGPEHRQQRWSRECLGRYPPARWPGASARWRM